MIHIPFVGTIIGGTVKYINSRLHKFYHVDDKIMDIIQKEMDSITNRLDTFRTNSRHIESLGSAVRNIENTLVDHLQFLKLQINKITNDYNKTLVHQRWNMHIDYLRRLPLCHVNNLPKELLNLTND